MKQTTLRRGSLENLETMTLSVTTLNINILKTLCFFMTCMVIIKNCCRAILQKDFESYMTQKMNIIFLIQADNS